MDFRQLESFRKVADLKSFSRAAEEVCLTQPSVSGHIQQLEEELGLRLFDRLGKEVALTAAGRCFYEYSTRLLALREEARQAIAELSGGVTGTLLIGGSTIPAEYVLPSLIGLFKEGKDRISVVLKVCDTAGVVKGLLDGEMEVGVIGALSDDPHLECRRFLSDRLVLIVPKDHRFGTSVTVQELTSEPFILRENGSGTRKFIEGILRTKKVNFADLNVVAEMGSTSALKSAIKGKVGVSILSIRAVEEELDSGRLRVVDIDGVGEMERSFYVVTNRTRSLSPLSRLFLDFLLDYQDTPVGIPASLLNNSLSAVSAIGKDMSPAARFPSL